MAVSFNDVTVPTSGQGDANQTTGAATDTNNSTVVDVTGTRPPVVADNSTPPATVQSDPSSGIDWTKIAQGAAGAIPAITNYLTNRSQANDQTQNAANFTKQANQYGTILNPYGAYRDAAAQKLQALQADPSSIVNTPGYKFSLQQGEGAIGTADNKRFGVGAGSTNPDLMNFAQGLASKTYNDTINQYSAQAGVPIGPQSAASIYQTGMLGNLASTQAANAAKGANTNLVGTTAGNLVKSISPALGSLISMFTNSGMSPQQAAAMAHQVMGTPTTTTTTDNSIDTTGIDSSQTPSDIFGTDNTGIIDGGT